MPSQSRAGRPRSQGATNGTYTHVQPLRRLQRPKVPPHLGRHPRERYQLRHLHRHAPRRFAVVDDHREHRRAARARAHHPLRFEVAVQLHHVAEHPQRHVGVGPGLELQQEQQPGAGTDVFARLAKAEAPDLVAVAAAEVGGDPLGGELLDGGEVECGEGLGAERAVRRDEIAAEVPDGLGMAVRRLVGCIVRQRRGWVSVGWRGHEWHLARWPRPAAIGAGRARVGRRRHRDHPRSGRAPAPGWTGEVDPRAASLQKGCTSDFRGRR